MKKYQSLKRKLKIELTKCKGNKGTKNTNFPICELKGKRSRAELSGAENPSARLGLNTKAYIIGGCYIPTTYD